ncbi:MAG TPA: glucose 1-dehydrogenase [Ktedonobacteraceae bacterium]|nr:glucose 1-dehydrogenase [Ktedonobacteraceae bacterium]
MKAIAVFPARREVKLIEQEEPVITQPDQAKLRMVEVGICGTDKEICSFKYGTPPKGSDYLVIGHEALGEVVEVGAAVTTLAPGDLVVPTVRRPCPHARCRSCRAGHQDFCETDDYTERGIKGIHGYLAEFVVDEAHYLNPVPGHLREIAVLVEPLTIAEKAEYQLYQLMQRRPPWIDPAVSERAQGRGHTALVLGAGPVGLLGAMALRTAEFETWIYSRRPTPNPQAEVAQAIGATYLSSQELPTSQLEARIGPIDLVYEAVGNSRLAFEVLRALGPNGVYVLTGLPGWQTLMKTDLAALFRDMVLKNQIVLGTVNAGPHDFRAAIADLEIFQQRWPEAVRALIAARTPMAQAVACIAGRPAGIKSVISLQR